MTSPETNLAGEVRMLLSLFPALRLRYCPLQPSPVQEAFLRLHTKEVFYGGGAGGGKSVALLMAALQYTDVPGYAALLLRPSLAELQLAGGLIDLSHHWLAASKARWNSDLKTWSFPGRGRSGAGGATLTFGYLANNDDVGRYAGTSYSFLGFDELTRFDEQQYTRMFRTLRQPDRLATGAAADGTTLKDVPARVRATSNPGGHGHAWVRSRFVDPLSRHPDVAWLPSRLADNPHLDQAAYLATLGELPNAERQRLIEGDWEIPDDGELFRRNWVEVIEPHQLPDSGYSALRYWDLAATEPSPANRDPDWTVGLLLYHHRASGIFYIADIVRERKAPGAVENLVAATAKRDGRTVQIVIEQEPGSAGKSTASRYTRHVLRGYSAYARPASGDKQTRAWPVAAAAENGLLKLVRGRHTNPFLDELSSFPHGKHDDCVDALSGAHTHINTHGPASIHVPKGRINLPNLSATHINRRYPHLTHDPHLDTIARHLGATTWPTPPPGIVTRD